MKRTLSILVAALMIFGMLPAQSVFAAEAPAKEAPAEAEAPVIEEPAFAPAEESAPVVEEPAEEPAPVIEEPAEEPAPVVEEPTEEPAPVEEPAPAEEPVPAEEPADAPVYKQGEPAEPVKASPFVDNDLNKLTQLNVTDCPNISNLY